MRVKDGPEKFSCYKAVQSFSIKIRAFCALFRNDCLFLVIKFGSSAYILKKKTNLF